MFEIIEKIFIESWIVFSQMAPYLLFGFLVAGILSVYVSSEWVERHLGGSGLTPVFKASLFGIPLPLCSCGVIPVSASFYRHGANRASTTSFLLSTPQTGVDSILVTYSLLGPVFAVFRPIAALITGVLGGALVQFFDSENGSGSAEKSAPDACEDDCCTGDEKENSFIRMLRYGFITLPKDIGTALLTGILIAGLISALVPPDYLTIYIGGGILSIMIMIIAGVPVYVCATASVPIAAGFMHIGASPGAALAFLIAGPATNAAAFTTVYKILGKRTAIIYMVTVVFSAFTCGLLLDWIIPFVESSFSNLGAISHEHHELDWISNTWSIILIGVLAASYLKKQKPKVVKINKDNHMQQIEFEVKGMTCSHCAESVRKAISESDGVSEVIVELENSKAQISGENIDTDNVIKTVTQLGYTARVI